MSAKMKAEKNQETLRKLALVGENRVCMDCTMKSTPYVVLDFGIFVCTPCAGVHRNFQFKPKGISMTNFKDSEVEFMKAHGNDVAHKTWRANWNPKTTPKPNVGDEAKIKKFIHDTYVLKKYYSSSNSGSSNASPSSPVVANRNSPAFDTSSSDLPEPQPIQKLIHNPAKIEVTRARTSSNATSFFDFTEDVKPNRASVNLKSSTSASSQQKSAGFDDFFGGNDSNGSGFAANNGSGFDDSEFEVDFSKADISSNSNKSATTATTSAPPKKAGFSLADELFSNFPTNPAPQPQQQQHQQQFNASGFGAAPPASGGGLDDFFSAPVSQPVNNNPYAHNQFNQQHQQHQQQQHHHMMNNPYGAPMNQPYNNNNPYQNMNMNPQQMGGWNNQQPNGPLMMMNNQGMGGAMGGGWNNQAPQHNPQPNAYGVNNNAMPQPSRGPQLNPAFQEQPKPVNNDPFANLGPSFSSSNNNTSTSTNNYRPPSTTTTSSNAFDDNPFDF